MLTAYLLDFVRTTLAWFAFSFACYGVAAGGAYLLFWRFGRNIWRHKRIQADARRVPEPGREFKLSLLTIAMFSVMLGLVRLLTDLGWTRMYADIGTYGIGYFVLSIVVIALVHDTYYYWAHRFMHSRLLFKHVHRIHHQFTNPTPFASYAFHPLEGMIEILIIGVLLFVMPIHAYALALYILILTLLNVVSHLGYEFYPAWISRWFITSTHHNLHHSRFTGHYMLYLNLWDRVMGSNYADYPALCARFAAASGRQAPAPAKEEGISPA